MSAGSGWGALEGGRGFIGLALIGLGLTAPLLLRALLWRACIPAKAGLRQVLGWTALGYALNQLVGFRTGDLLRVAAARKVCGGAAGASSVLLFRAIELCSLLLVLALFVSSRFAGGARAWLLFAAAAAALLLLPPLARRWGATRVLAPLASLTPGRLSALLGAAFAANAAEAALFVGVAGLLGQSLPLTDACLLLAVVNVGQLAAILPANLGTFEASAAAGLAALGWSGPALWLLPAWTHAARLGASAFLLVVLLPIASEHFSFLRGGLRWLKHRP